MASALPLEVHADGRDDVDGLIERAAAEREGLEAQLLANGALLFRGWQVETLADFRRFVTAFAGTERLFDYSGGASPRSDLGDKSGGVYSSTDYPPHVALSLHNELSYAGIFPSRLYFFCLVPANEGGETTLGDSRRILAGIDADVLERFRRKGIRYIRNLSPYPGSGYSWQEAFATTDAAEAETRCRDIGADFHWSEDGVLRISQLRPATAVHPRTGDEVWFNQADGFHPTALDAETYRALLNDLGSEDRFRLNVSYGDGSSIEAQALDHIRSVIERETIPHRWRAGDIIVIDNLLAAHGRRPFSGARKIALAMT